MLTTFVEGGWPFNRYSREVLLLSFSPPSYASRLMGISMLQNKQIKMLMRKMRDASTSQFDLNRKTWMSSRNGEKCITSTRQQHIGAAETRTWPRETQGSSNGIQALHEVLCRGQRERSGQCQQPLGRERPGESIDACFDDFYSSWLLNTACRIAQKPLCSCEFYRRQCDVMGSFYTYTCFHSINIFLLFDGLWSQ